MLKGTYSYIWTYNIIMNQVSGKNLGESRSTVRNMYESSARDISINTSKRL